LIKCSLQHVIEFGWNEKAISQACLDLDLSSVYLILNDRVQIEY